MGLADATKQYLTRAEVKESLEFHHSQVLKQEMEGKSKCHDICNRFLRKIQDNMKEKSLENSRVEVLWLKNMIDSRKTMKGKYNEPYTCPHCSDGLEAGAIESPLQLMSCKAYEDLRQGIDPELDQKERPGYLRKVISRRKDLESKLQRRS